MKTKNRIGLVVPHIFLHRDIMPDVIFSPGQLALDLANGLVAEGVDVTLFSPGPVDTKAKNINADLSYFEKELALRGDSYTDLLKKHPFTFVTLARQVQSELIAKAYAMAHNDELDVVHIYTNEEDTALPFAKLCNKPVVFTHHDPFNFLIKYKNLFPKYPELNWISISMDQRKAMPKNTHWVANIYHGLDPKQYKPNFNSDGDYIAYMGRIIEPKGLHLAIEAVKLHNQTSRVPLKLKIAGKHYAEHSKDTYWQKHIQPELNQTIEFVGFIKETKAKNNFLTHARAQIMPSLWNEPFGMVMIEALASGTPVVGLDSGAIPEIVEESKTGFVVKKGTDEKKTIQDLTKVLTKLDTLDRKSCRTEFEQRFTLQRMCQEHLDVYQKLQNN